MTDSLRVAGLAPLALIAALLLPALPAHAERADRDKPLVLEADNASYDDVKQVYHLTGNVVLTKGTMVLRSDAAELRTDSGGHRIPFQAISRAQAFYPFPERGAAR